MNRPDNRLERAEYLSRARSMAMRGTELPQSKLTNEDVIAIRSAAKQRDNLRKHIKDNLSNKALARKHGVHIRTVEKVLQNFTWSHV